jgi:hypothetical protein
MIHELNITCNIDIVGDSFRSTNDNLTCSYCNKSYKNKYSLAYHSFNCTNYNIQLHKLYHYKFLCNEIAKHATSQKQVIDLLNEQIAKDSLIKSQIIAASSSHSHKPDVLHYLQTKCKDTPCIEYPEVVLNQELYRKYMSDSPLLNAFDDFVMRNKKEPPLWCLDASREKFAIKGNNEWELDYGGVQIVKYVFGKLHNAFMKYGQECNEKLMASNMDFDTKLKKITDMNNTIVALYGKKQERDFIKMACNKYMFKYMDES